MRKPEPFTVNVNAGPSAAVELGERLEIESARAVIVKVAALVTNPPGLTTVTLALPCAEIRLAATDAISWFPLTKLLTSAKPFQFTADPERKPEPFTVNVNAGPPAVTELGERLEIEGVGALIVKISERDTIPPGFATVTLAVPGIAIRLGATDAVSWFPLT